MRGGYLNTGGLDYGVGKWRGTMAVGGGESPSGGDHQVEIEEGGGLGGNIHRFI